MKKIYLNLVLVSALLLIGKAAFSQGATGINIIDAATDAVVGPLTEGYEMDSATASGYNFDGVYTGDGYRGAFIMRKDGEEVLNRSEGVAPYAAFQDNAGDFGPWSAFSGVQPSPGNWSIDFFLVNANGETEPAVGDKITLGFVITGSGGSSAIAQNQLNSTYVVVNEGMLNINLASTQVASFQLVGMNGATFMQKTLGAQNTVLPLDVPTGLYIARIIQGEEITTQKIIVR